MFCFFELLSTESKTNVISSKDSECHPSGHAPEWSTLLEVAPEMEWFLTNRSLYLNSFANSCSIQRPIKLTLVGQIFGRESTFINSDQIGTQWLVQYLSQIWQLFTTYKYMSRLRKTKRFPWMDFKYTFYITLMCIVLWYCINTSTSFINIRKLFLNFEKAN